MVVEEEVRSVVIDWDGAAELEIRVEHSILQRWVSAWKK